MRSSARKLIVGVVAVAIVGGLAGLVAAEGDLPTFGPPGTRPDGTWDLSKVPERIPVGNSEGDVVGYADRDVVFAPPPGPEVSEEPIPVFEDESRNLVGHLTVNGFVPLDSAEQ